jgi:CcmD family protein
MDDLDYLFTTFTVAWAVIFLYILLLSFRQRKLQRRMELLETKQYKEKQ